MVARVPRRGAGALLASAIVLRCLALAALLGGCNWAFGLEPAALGDGGAGADGPEDAVVTDDGARCSLTQTLGAGSPRAIGFGAATIEADAVAAQGASHFVVGVYQGRGLVLKRDEVAPAAWLVQAGTNDQLWGVAPGTTDALAVGMSRTTSGTPHDRGMIVTLSGGLSPKAWVVEDGVENVQFAAVHSPGDAWFVAGRHEDGARIIVAQFDLDHDVVAAASLQLDATQNHRVLDVVADSTRVFVAGQFGTAEAPGESFLIGLSRSNPQPIWVRRPDFTAFDLSIDGGELVVAGVRGADGLIARLAPDSGALRSAQRLPGRPLHGVIAAGAERWIAGPDPSGGTFVGRLDGDCATVTPHTAVLRATPLARPSLLVAGGGAATLYGANPDRTKILQRLVDGNGASTCAATATTAAVEPTTVTLGTGGAASMSVTLVKTAVASALVTAESATVEPACE